MINNASNNPKLENDQINNIDRLENFSLDKWNNDINVSLTGTLICCKYYGYQISKNPQGGSIINISSDLGIISPDQRLYKVKNQKNDQQPVKPISYSVVKSGLIGFTKYMSTYWCDKNVDATPFVPEG